MTDRQAHRNAAPAGRQRAHAPHRRPASVRLPTVLALVGIVVLGTTSTFIIFVATRPAQPASSGGAAIVQHSAIAPAADLAWPDRTLPSPVAPSPASAPQPAASPPSPSIELDPVTLPDGRGAALATIRDPVNRAQAMEAIHQQRLVSMMDALNERAARQSRIVRQRR